MKKLNFLFCLLVILSCKKDQIFTPFPTPNILLTAIEYSTDNKSWTEEFVYNTDNQLIQVENNGNENKRYELIYQQNQLVKINVYSLSSSQLILRIELVYNEQEQLIEALNYSIYEREEVLRIYEYEYNKNGFPIKQSSYMQDNEASMSVEEYTWKNGNVVKTKTYYEGTLYHEFFYKYDDAFNYFSVQTHKVNQFQIWNQNNIIESSYKDHTGLLDTYCNPCLTNYAYNEIDYPIVIDFNGLINYQLTYQ